MAYQVGDGCINCGSCASECPSEEAIIEKDDRRWIDPEKCQNCGACAEACPISVITEV